MEFAALDLAYLMDELEELEEGFVQKAYQRDDELTLEIYVPGDEKKRLIIGTSYAFLSDYKRDNPERPPGFVMELRKQLGRVDSIKQRGFDRILEIESGEQTLICELFGKGNFALLKDGKVIGALRQEEFADRKIVVGEEYEPPEPSEDPLEMDDIFETMEGELVRSLARDLSLGGTYAEEIVARTQLEKDRNVEELEESEKEEVREAFSEVISTELDPILYYKDDVPERAAPFELETYSDHRKEDKDKFSEALDELFYQSREKRLEKKRREKYEEKKQGIEKKLEQQERKAEGLEKSAEQNRRRAELMYENYQMLEEIKSAAEEGIKEHGWKETEEKFEEAENKLTDRINSFNEQERFISVDLGEDSVKIEPGKDLEATASEYYDSAKEREQKAERAREAMEETREQLEELEEETFEVSEDSMEDRSEKRSKKWFEKYRWFHTSEGNLVCVGRDAQTNEMLAQKHMESNDLYFHADFDGGPTVVLKDGQDAGEESREQAAKAAVTFSKTWKAGIGADSVYCVEPDQVTKDPESGEYLSKGAFVIRGEREYMHNVKVEASIGVYELEGHPVPVCGPIDAVNENCEAVIDLEPGRRKKSDIAKEINRKFADEGFDVDLDYIIRALPPGRSGLE